jgi:hypothetical protein
LASIVLGFKGLKKGFDLTHGQVSWRSLPDRFDTFVYPDLTFAVIIRAVDGDNRLGPSALAAAILAHPDLDWLPTSKTTLPITN